MSILKGARNLDNAKLFVDWVLSKEAQELAWKKGKSYQILTNTSAETFAELAEARRPEAYQLRHG